jgi:hypothetical protein
MLPAKNLLQTNGTLNLTLSKRAGKKVKAAPNACWQNAYRALMQLPELSSGCYVEGWIVNIEIPVPLEHAWIELAGQIIDPTPVMWRETHAYFPGLRFTKAEVLQTVRDETELPIASRFGAEGIKSPAYRTAWKQAFFFGMPKDKVEKLLKEDVSM